MKPLPFFPAAIPDIEDIHEFTEKNWSDVEADAYLRQLQAACDDIATGRRQGRALVSDRPAHLFVSSGSHFIVCRETTASILVVRILNQRMDLSRHF
ncbi:type II toxin-antitoxin system RelE/ParE family toxin [Rhizobium sp. TRM95111]|uniref:type II toxin-antitoxin system RelE/ParE family toxin n=1 Tax=Rhizobium alarense TaxID=2846851 RepID=UPI001F484E71|nr:type II toxin-antitoxin system RelE/ParE family toxin [Rhizobium alarense]MCF3640039.1 type II toxin-antitoxin system RelE/ParE family toxin [Rhizobium alarense]